MLEALQGMYSIILLLAVVLYSGELIWKERSLELDEILDSMPTPSGVYFGAKLTALVLVIAVVLLAGVMPWPASSSRAATTTSSSACTRGAPRSPPSIRS
jgi:hypothetical protein